MKMTGTLYNCLLWKWVGHIGHTVEGFSCPVGFTDEPLHAARVALGLAHHPAVETVDDPRLSPVSKNRVHEPGLLLGHWDRLKGLVPHGGERSARYYEPRCVCCTTCQSHTLWPTISVPKVSLFSLNVFHFSSNLSNMKFSMWTMVYSEKVILRIN